MNKSPTFADFNPTNDERVSVIKAKTDEMISLVNEFTPDNGPAKRRAALAVTNYEQAAMWAVKALFS